VLWITPSRALSFIISFCGFVSRVVSVGKNRFIYGRATRRSVENSFHVDEVAASKLSEPSLNRGSTKSSPRFKLFHGSHKGNVKPPQTIGAAGDHKQESKLRVR
jgi:hypothetical protein